MALPLIAEVLPLTSVCNVVTLLWSPVIAVDCELIVPSVEVTRVSSDEIAVALPLIAEVLPAISVCAVLSPLSSAVIAVACEVMVPSAEVIRVPSEEIAVELAETPPSAVVNRTSMAVTAVARAVKVVVSTYVLSIVCTRASNPVVGVCTWDSRVTTLEASADVSVTINSTCSVSDATLLLVRLIRWLVPFV